MKGTTGDEVSRLLVSISRPEVIRSLPELFQHPEIPPPRAGVYGWWFAEVPRGVPTAHALTVGGRALLYVGIAPRRPPTTPKLKRHLRKRIDDHVSDDASRSTLRKTLGVLLATPLKLRLQCIRDRWTFGDGEDRLSAWMAVNARVSWVEHREPWTVEPAICQRLFLPLNLEHNEHCTFYATLKTLRRDAKE